MRSSRVDSERLPRGPYRLSQASWQTVPSVSTVDCFRELPADTLVWHRALSVPPTVPSDQPAVATRRGQETGTEEDIALNPLNHHYVNTINLEP